MQVQVLQEQVQYKYFSHNSQVQEAHYQTSLVMVTDQFLLSFFYSIKSNQTANGIFILQCIPVINRGPTVYDIDYMVFTFWIQQNNTVYLNYFVDTVQQGVAGTIQLGW